MAGTIRRGLSNLCAIIGEILAAKLDMNDPSGIIGRVCNLCLLTH